MASEKILNQKKEAVAQLAKKIQEAKVVLLTAYKGINVSDATSLRLKLRDIAVEYKVIKNNITKRALAECKIEDFNDILIEPIALVMGNDDYLGACKIIYDYAKDNEFYKIKGGIIDGKVVSAEEIITLAKLPSREVLIAKLAGALLGNITKLAIALDKVSKQKAETANA